MKELIIEAETMLGIMGNQVTQFLVREFVLDVEVYGYKHTFQSRIMLFYCFACFVAFGCNVRRKIVEMIPPDTPGEVKTFFGLEDGFVEECMVLVKEPDEP